MSRMNWDRVHRERNLRRWHPSDSDDLMIPVSPPKERVRPPVCPVCTLMHPGEC